MFVIRVVSVDGGINRRRRARDDSLVALPLALRSCMARGTGSALIFDGAEGASTGDSRCVTLAFKACV